MKPGYFSRHFNATLCSTGTLPAIQCHWIPRRF